MADIFADVPSEGATLDIDKAFERLETKGDKTSSESQPEKKETDKPSQKGDNTSAQPTPFHKHPRWIQTQRELKELREETARLKTQGTNQQQLPVPKWWGKLPNETDEQAIARFHRTTEKDGELDWIKSQVLESIKSEQQAEQGQAKAGEEYVNTQLAELADEGLKFEKNALLKFMVDFQAEYGAGALLDTEGNYDFRKSLALMEKMQPETQEPNTAKQVAMRGGRGKPNSQSASKIPVLSRNALRRGNWRDADTGQFTS
jgi:hypothetical protein